MAEDLRNAACHARSFDVDGRQILAMLDVDEGDRICITFRAWSDVTGGPITWSLRLVGETERGHEIFGRSCRQMIGEISEGNLRQALAIGGFWELLETAEALNG